MKTVSLIFTLMTFTLNVIGQITEKVVYQEKGETETYEIRKGDKSKFMMNLVSEYTLSLQ